MKIIKSEINDYVGIINNLNDKISSNTTIIDKINAFKDNATGQLEGPAWEAIKNSFTTTYVGLIKKENDLYTELINGINKAKDIMLSYFEGFPDGSKETLDDDGEVYNKYKTDMETNYNLWIESLKPKVVGKDAYGNDIKKIVENLEAKQKYELYKKCLEYLRQLPATDNNANNALESSRTILKSLSTQGANATIFTSNISTI